MKNQIWRWDMAEEESFRTMNGVISEELFVSLQGLSVFADRAEMHKNETKHEKRETSPLYP